LYAGRKEYGFRQVKLALEVELVSMKSSAKSFLKKQVGDYAE
jgi:hypothetical protein